MADCPRVLQIFKYYTPHIGGVEKVIQDIAEGLKGQVDTKVLTCHEAAKTVLDEVNGIEVTRAGRLFTRFSVPVTLQFPQLMRSMAADRDILHFHLPYPWADFCYLIARPHGRVVVWWHSEIVKPKYLTKLYKPFLRQFLKKADRIIVAAPQLVDKSPFLMPFKNKCCVIPIGIDTSRFVMNFEMENSTRAVKERYKNKKIVLFVGRLIYYKGLSYLIEAMAQIRRSDVVLLVVGEGPLRSQMENLSNRLGITDYVVFLGRLDDHELTSYFHGCDVFVLPSIANTEAFGIVQLEAMACGKPVVSTDLPTGVPFINQHEKTGLVVPPKDAGALAKAIERILSDDELAGAYGAAGKQRVQEEFTVSVMLKRVQSLYEEVLTPRPGTLS
jgi:glycosyltransferase involved in cell wall biosynthesis